MNELNKIVPDTSILIQGKLSEMIKEGKITKTRIIIPKAVIDELQAQASRGRETGFQGLEEIKRIRVLGKEKGISIEFTGKRPTLEEIQLASKGRIDAIIRDVAQRENAVLLTGDYVQALVGEAEGVSVQHVVKPFRHAFYLEKFFTKDTQSVHLKAGVYPLAKRGMPGEIKLVQIRNKKITEAELEQIINQIIIKTKKSDNAFIEIGKLGAMVIQLGDYRISINRPPFSDSLEVTAVRPITKVKLSDYKMHKELENRIVSKSQGILVAGPPGAGKSSFASALGNFLSQSGMIVKTFEQPRDLQVGPEISQYAPLEGDWEKTADILLLVRPDYTIFDEVRKTKDFKVFGDMRLSGVGMIGVVHSTSPVSAIQRFIGRLELGVIPYVIDTVIYINAGRIEKVFDISLTVKKPTGMKEDDLTRPVVEIRDFGTKELEFEIYTFGDENIIVPVKQVAKDESPLKKLASEAIYNTLRRWDPQMDIEFLSDDRIAVKVRNDVIPRLIGKNGQNIEEIERTLGIHISVEPRESTFKKPVSFDVKEIGSCVNLRVSNEYIGEQVDIYDNEEMVSSAFVGKKGVIKIRKKSDLGRRIVAAISRSRLKIFA